MRGTLATKKSRRRVLWPLDCFAALAMTVKLTEQFLGIAFVRRRVAEILSRFLDLSMLCKQENFPPASFGAPRPSLAMRAVPERGAFVRRSPQSAARPNTRCSGLEASETIPLSGADSIFSSRCGAISGRLRPSPAMRPVSERGALLPSGAELRPARSRNGDRVRPSPRSSWGWDEAV